MWILETGRGAFENNSLIKLAEDFANSCIERKRIINIKRITYLVNTTRMCAELLISDMGIIDFYERVDSLITVKIQKEVA